MEQLICENAKVGPSEENLEALFRRVESLPDGERLLTELNKLLNETRLPVNLRNELVISLGNMLLGKNLSQGNESTLCSAGAMVTSLVRSNPMRLISMISAWSLGQDFEGHSMPHSLSEIKNAKDRVNSKYGLTSEMGLANTIALVGVMEIINGAEYQVDLADPLLASRAVTKVSGMPERITGAFDSWIDRGGDLVFGRSKEFRYVDNATAVRRDLIDGKLVGAVVQLKVTDSVFHIVSLSHFDPTTGRVHFLDSQFHTDSGKQIPLNGFKSEGGHEWSIPLSVLLPSNGDGLMRGYLADNSGKELDIEGDRSYAIYRSSDKAEFAVNSARFEMMVGSSSVAKAGGNSDKDSRRVATAQEALKVLV